jgi:tetratricopeptide (TPR) repeat protein
MYEELGNDDKAYENLRLATKGDLDTPEAFFKLGQLCLKMKKFDEAEVEFNKLISLGVENEQIWFNLANATFMLGNHDKAISIYERLVAKNPLDSRYIYNLAESYFTKNDYARAYDMFRRATTISQPLGQAFFRAAHCLEKMNNVEGAKAYLKSLEGVNAPAEFKKVLTTELMRLELQSKIKVTSDGKTQIAYKDLRNVMLPHINAKKNEEKKA